jgi:hypothetical protein
LGGAPPGGGAGGVIENERKERTSADNASPIIHRRSICGKGKETPDFSEKPGF